MTKLLLKSNFLSFMLNSVFVIFYRFFYYYKVGLRMIQSFFFILKIFLKKINGICNASNFMLFECHVSQCSMEEC